METDPQFFAAGVRPRRRGRPRAAEPLTSLSVRIPVTLYDHLASVAIRRDATVSKLVRALLLRHLKSS